MARNKPQYKTALSLGPDSFKQDAHKVQEVQYAQEENTRGTGSAVHEVQEVQVVHEIEFGATQGRKGHKAPRINMAFSPANHAWIKKRSKQLGISATELVNNILDRERMKE